MLLMLLWNIILLLLWNIIIHNDNNYMIRIGVFGFHSIQRQLIPNHHYRSLYTRSSYSKGWSIMMGLSSLSSSNDVTNEVLLGKVQIPITTAISCHGLSNVVYIDGSWWLGKRTTTNRHDYEVGPLIANAYFFDIDDICTPSGSKNNPMNLPHMMPSSKTFAMAMDAMNIHNTDHIIVYGQKGCPFIYRAYFQLVCMGHDYDRVHILDGSLHDWITFSGPIDTNPTRAFVVSELDQNQPTSYVAAPTARNVVTKEDIINLIPTLGNVNKNDPTTTTCLVDVRSSDRFYGRVEEPRPGLRLGHMPGAKNLFFHELLDPDEPTKLKSQSELRHILTTTLGSDILSSERIIATCGSGATACVLATALLTCGMDPSKVYIYDGSWCEWGSDPNTPIVQE